MTLLIPAVVPTVVLALAAAASPIARDFAETDLDALMRQVLARRDDNWTKLQQYILDEREQIEIRGPSRAPVWGERREYTWYIRDGYFIRSPVRINGAQLSDSDRLRYEAEFLRKTRERDERDSQQSAESRSSTGQVGTSGVDGLIRQVREPEFVSSAYFLRFKFEEGKYAFVGREAIDGRETLRVEYFPTRLFSDRQRRQMARDHNREDPQDAALQRMLNKVALVTIWIEPASSQIVKYTFDNIDFGFLPGQWLVRLNSVRASMIMSQPFPNVWLPRDLEFLVDADAAAGRFDVRWTINYHDYRQADVKTKVHVGPQR